MRTSLILLLSTWLCLAQLPVVPLQRYAPVAVTPTTPLNVTNTIAWYWKSLDIASNSTVTLWTDELQSRNFFQATSGNRPTNATQLGGPLGVYFASGKFLNGSNDVAAFANTNSIMVILYLPYAGANNNNRFFTDSGDGFGQGIHTSQHWYEQNGATDYSAGPVNTNSYLDLIYAGNSGGSQLDCYTNGILATHSVAAFGQNPGIGLGNGSGVGASRDYVGYITEVAIWTNNLLAPAVSNLHYYRTNTYGGSP